MDDLTFKAHLARQDQEIERQSQVVAKQEIEWQFLRNENARLDIKDQWARFYQKELARLDRLHEANQQRRRELNDLIARRVSEQQEPKQNSKRSSELTELVRRAKAIARQGGL